MAADRSYLMLFQHSKHQRHVMASETDVNEQVYRRARVRTPAENAQRDFLGNVWLHYLANELANTQKGLVYLKTIGATSNQSIESLPQVTVLDAASDPYGWNNDDKQENTFNTDELTCEDLQKLINVIQTLLEKQKRPIVIESLTPILMRHGLPRTMVFIQQLVKLNTTIVVPILVETLTPEQNRAMEDLAQALLYLKNGDLVLVRQGVREKGNVIRETILYNVHTNEVTGKISLEVLAEENIKDETGVSVNSRAASLGGLTLNDDKYTPSIVAARPGKVKLKIEDEDTGSSTKQDQVKRPHIYVENNDVEFDDLDEEDPDDDLDI